MAITEDQQGIEGGAGEWKRELFDATPEREGELSRWVTLRALVVLQHFLGLSIEGKA